MERKLIKINGINPFESVKLKGNHSVFPKFELKYAFWEHCTSDRNWVCFEDEHKEKYYYMVKLLSNI